MQINNANGTNTCYIYDALHRVTDVGGVTTCRRYRYDSVSHGLRTQPAGSTISNPAGRLIEAQTDNCGGSPTMLTDEWFSYDKDGRLTDVWETTPYLVTNSLGYYHTTVSYFGNGALNTLSGIPGFTTETYGLEGEGRLSTAAEGSNNMMRSVVYNAAGQPTNINLGSSNGTDNDVYTYDSNTGRMTTWTFTVGSTVGSNTQAGVLTWNPIGTLKTMAVTDHFNSIGTQTCNFGTTGNMGYDDWNRLVYDDCGSGGWGQQYSYDQYDNLTKSQLSGRTGSTFNPGYNAANNQFASGFGATYDASGNLTYDTAHHYAWDAYEKVQSVDATGTNCSSGGNCFVYDAFGQAVENDSNGAASEILYSPVGKTAVMNGMTVTYAYIPMPGGSVQLKPNNTTRRYQHKDWLGSSRVIATLSSVVQGGYAFSPYGEVESSNSYGSVTNEPNFTGDTQDLVAGLFDTPNRELSGVGRWINPDPARAGWNQYAYPTNPNSFVDPSGEVQQIRPGGLPVLGWICAPDGSGCRTSAGNTSGVTCTVDGLDTPCTVAQGLLTNGAAVQCPNNDCTAYGSYTGFDSKGGYYDLQLVAGVNGPVWINNFNGDEIDADAVADEFGLSLPDDQLIAANNATLDNRANALIAAMQGVPGLKKTTLALDCLALGVGTTMGVPTSVTGAPSYPGLPGTAYVNGASSWIEKHAPALSEFLDSVFEKAPAGLAPLVPIAGTANTTARCYNANGAGGSNHP